MNTMSIYTAAITLILVMDPVGNIPLFLSILKGIPPKRQAWIILRESLVAFVILTLFLFFGGQILHGLNITEPALNISGGIILFIIAIRMIFPHADTQTKDPIAGEPFIVPLAIPLTAGPASLATVMLLASQQPDQIGACFIAIIIASAIFTAILLCSRYLMHILKMRGLIALERLMGMILTTVAVQMFLTGVGEYFQI